MGQTSSLSRAIACAAAAHVLAALAVRVVPVTYAPRATEPQAIIEITPEVESANVARPPSPPPISEEHAGATTNAVAAVMTTSPIANAPTSAAPVDNSAPGDAGWFDPVRVATAAPVLLGRRVELRTGAAKESAPRSDGAMTAVRDALDAHDQSIGLGRAGPLQAAAHEAASSTVAPDTGVGQLEIDCDGEGRVVAVRTSQSSWQPVATRLARVMAGKTMRVRPGSHGLRVKLRIVAERTPPSGHSKTTASPGAVPDEVCDGEGLTRRCVAGLPVGVSVSGQDLSNLGARASRVVHVNVDSETDL